MKRRSTTVAIVGAATLVVGAGTTFAAVTSHASTAPAHAPAKLLAAPADPAPGQTADGTLHIPDGHQALAVSLEQVPGGAGIVGTGDHIDVFAAVTHHAEANTPEAHFAHLILQNVEVLKVTPGTPPAGGSSRLGTAPNPAEGSYVFVLAVTPPQAEKLVYHDAFSKLWFSLVPAGQAPLGPPPGATTANELQAG